MPWNRLRRDSATLVGGGAVLLHGYPRFTADLDILIEASEENARHLLDALCVWGEGAGAAPDIAELASPQPGAVRIDQGGSAVHQ